MLLEFLRSVGGAQDFVKEFVGGLDLAPDLVNPFVRDMTVGASRTNARSALVVNGLLQLLVYVVPHLVAGNAELLGIRYFHRPVEAAPE
jgi:hypothetical protein